MKTRFFCIGLLAVFFLGLIEAIPVPRVEAQPNLRAMERRAQTVAKRKNRYVGQVLDEHGIGYQLNNEGVITSISLDGSWKAVQRIDVIPMTRYRKGHNEVVGHEVYLFTAQETIRFFSNRVAR